MNYRIVRLCNQCIRLGNNNKLEESDLYLEIVNLVRDSNASGNHKLDLLVELYKYWFYHSVKTSIDPRGNKRLKTDILIKIKKYLLNGNIDENIINDIRKVNDLFKFYIEHPLKMVDAEIKFYEENPKVKF